MKIHKPFIKTKLFGEREKAIVWLRKEYQSYLDEKETAQVKDNYDKIV